MIGNGWGRPLESNRVPEDEEDEDDAYGSFWSGYGLSLKLSGDVSLTFSSTIFADASRECALGNAISMLYRYDGVTEAIETVVVW
jgi:hypothetical protein